MTATVSEIQSYRHPPDAAIRRLSATVVDNHVILTLTSPLFISTSLKVYSLSDF